jgi:hypothetical protein
LLFLSKEIMKKNFVALLIVFVTVSAFTFLDTTNDIAAAIKAGNYKTIAGYFNANVELNMPGNEGMYSKAQAESILKDFFSKNSPKNYTPKHDGQSNDGSQYSIGVLETSGGTYRTYFFLKKQPDGFKIKEFRIETQK